MTQREGLEGRRFFVGLICVQKKRDLTTIDQHNETWIGSARSRDEVVGAWARASLDKHPGGAIVYQDAYDVTDAVLDFARATLSEGAGKGEGETRADPS